MTHRALATAWLVVLGLLVPGLASAAPKQPGRRPRCGFYMDGRLGFGFGYVTSEASISNGFQQPIESSARGLLLPTAYLGVGGTVARGWVVGGVIGASVLRAPVIETLDRSFQIDDLGLETIEIGPFVNYYPDPDGGLYVGFAVPFTGIETRSERDGDGDGDVRVEQSHDLGGVGVALEVGHSWWIGKRWYLGGAARTLGARMLGRGEPAANVYTSGLYVSLILH